MTPQEALEKIATCLCAQLTDCGPEVCFCGVVPGDVVAADYGGGCESGCGGIAWVRMQLAYPSKILGAQNTDPQNCDLAMGMDIEIGVLRCISAGDDAGNAPSAAELLAATQQQTADLMAMWKALSCCGFGKDMIIGAYTPAGPAGGLVGGSFLLSIQVF